MLEAFAKLVPGELLQESGNVFYSGRDAFSAPASLYLLGLNPGGDPFDSRADTIERSIENVLHEPPNWSAYRDSSWAGADPGTYKMQPRVLHLLEKAELSPGKIPASNIIFTRSRQENSLTGDVESLKESCWSFHRAVIEELKPKVILCFGQTSGKWVCKKLNATQQTDEFVENNNRKWRSRSFTNQQGTKVVVATHPGRANWASPSADPSCLVVRALSL